MVVGCVQSDNRVKPNQVKVRLWLSCGWVGVLTISPVEVICIHVLNLTKITKVDTIIAQLVS